MKNIFCYFLVLAFLLSPIFAIADSDKTQDEIAIRTIPGASSVYEPFTQNKAKDEITFRNIPWGTNYPDCKSNIGLMFFTYSGEHYKTFPLEQIIGFDDIGKEIPRFDESDINLSATSFDSIVVAGYDVSETNLYFVYIPVDGILTREENDTYLYAASYTIETISCEDVYGDLKVKLAKLYGEPLEEYSDLKFVEKGFLTSDKTYTYTFMGGANDTMCILRSVIYDKSNPTKYDGADSVSIYYLRSDADRMLLLASETLAKNKFDEEQSKIGNEDLSGL